MTNKGKGAFSEMVIGDKKVEGGLRLQVTGEKGKKHFVLIGLQYDDAYTISIQSYRGGRLTKEVIESDIYAEQLPEVLLDMYSDRFRYV